MARETNKTGKPRTAPERNRAFSKSNVVPNDKNLQDHNFCPKIFYREGKSGIVSVPAGLTAF
jgi:hypothetical protein